MNLDEERDIISEKISKVTDAILLAMKHRNIGRGQLAQWMGVSSTYISQLLTGDTNMTLKTILRIEQALGIEILRLPSDKEFNNLGLHNNINRYSLYMLNRCISDLEVLRDTFDKVTLPDISGTEDDDNTAG